MWYFSNSGFQLFFLKKKKKKTLSYFASQILPLFWMLKFTIPSPQPQACFKTQISVTYSQLMNTFFIHKPSLVSMLASFWR